MIKAVITIVIVLMALPFWVTGFFFAIMKTGFERGMDFYEYVFHWLELR